MMRLAGSLAGLLVIAGWHTFAAQPVQSPVPIDFSFAGFEAGKPIPSVKAVVAVKPSGLDDTSLLQTAIGHVAVLSLQADGFRSATLLRAGRFHVAGQLHLPAGSIVLRGSGSGADGTAIIAEGNNRHTDRSGRRDRPEGRRSVSLRGRNCRRRRTNLQGCEYKRPRNRRAHSNPMSEHFGMD
jgi:hypothetical protein